MDRLEEESRQAIIHYRERMDEAIKALGNTVEKYRVILGDERVSFESSTLKVLEDLKLSQEKLLKLLPYFPLIRDLSWRPSRVVNDKIYDIRVELEVISPLNTLAEVEVSLIPVEYEYFITNYGMSREDYPKAFPPEDIKTIKLKPAGSEREKFNIAFIDIVGGREYLIKAVAKDVADSTNSEERKTPYIREFENIAPLDDVIVIADYYTWYEKPSELGNHWRYFKEEINGPSQHLQNPLLGEYGSGDPIVIAKHIDWATGHGIDAFSISWHTTGNDERTWDYHVTRNFEGLLNNFLTKDIKFTILYEDYDRLRRKIITYEYDSVHGTELIPVDDPGNKERLISDFKFFAKNYFNHPQYLRINGKHFVQFDADRIWIGDIKGTILQLREEIKREGYELYLCSNILGWYFPNAPYDLLEPRNRQIVGSMNGISASGNTWLYGYEDARKDFPSFVENLYKRWYSYAVGVNQGIQLLPNLMPGAETHPLVAPPQFVPLNRSAKLWRELAQIGKKYGKIWKVTSFNEWITGHHIEPSEEDEFLYLEALKNTLKA
jgi:hypothetical protein